MLKRQLLISIAALTSLSACGLGIIPQLNPQSLGDISRTERDMFFQEKERVCELAEPAPPIRLTGGVGRRAMTGHYFLERSPATGLEEVGRIDLVIDFASETESPRGSFIYQFEDVEFTRVTGFPAAAVDSSVGWIVEPERYNQATAGVTVPVTPERPSPRAIIDIDRGVQIQVVIDGEDPGATRAFDHYFSGEFVQPEEFGLFPLAVCGQVRAKRNTGPLIGTFYLEQG